MAAVDYDLLNNDHHCQIILPRRLGGYSEPIELQAQSEREKRVAPPIQCAIKLAGAIHSVDVAINVNR